MKYKKKQVNAGIPAHSNVKRNAKQTSTGYDLSYCNFNLAKMKHLRYLHRLARADEVVYGEDCVSRKHLAAKLFCSAEFSYWPRTLKLLSNWLLDNTSDNCFKYTDK